MKINSVRLRGELSVIKIKSESLVILSTRVIDSWTGDCLVKREVVSKKLCRTSKATVAIFKIKNEEKRVIKNLEKC